MNRDRWKGYKAGRDHLRWAVEKAERLEAENWRYRHILGVIHSFAFGDDAHDLDPEDLLERIRILAYQALATKPQQENEA